MGHAFVLHVVPLALQISFVLLDSAQYCLPSEVFHRISLAFLWDPYHSVYIFVIELFISTALRVVLLPYTAKRLCICD